MSWNPNLPYAAPVQKNLGFGSMAGYGNGSAPAYAQGPSQFLATNPYPSTSWAAQPQPQQMQFPMASLNGEFGQNFDSSAAPGWVSGGDLPGGAMLGSSLPSMPAQPAWGGITKTLQDWGVIDSYDKTTGQKSGSWGGLALGAAQGIGSAYLGMQQYKLAKETLANNKAQFDKNFEAQKGLTNANLEDRQKRRNIERSDSMAASDYMFKYGVK